MTTFSSEVLDAAEREREVTFTTRGRKSGNPHSTVIWVWGDGQRATFELTPAESQDSGIK